MIQWDQFSGVFGCLDFGDMCGGKYVVFMVVVVDNYCQGCCLYFNVSFGVCFVYCFCFVGDIDYMGFICGVNMGQL